MAATETGVWGLQEVRDKILASEWSYTGATELWVQGNNGSGKLGLNQGPGNNFSSPKQLPGTNWGMGTQCTNTTLNNIIFEICCTCSPGTHVAYTTVKFLPFASG